MPDLTQIHIGDLHGHLAPRPNLRGDGPGGHTAGEETLAAHVIHRMAHVWRSMERQFAVFGMLGLALDEAPLREARDLTVKCLTSRLKVESTGILDVADGGYESTVTSEIMLRFDPDASRIYGEAPLVNTAFKFKSPCGATSITGDGDFVVNRLQILSARLLATHIAELDTDGANTRLARE